MATHNIPFDVLGILIENMATGFEIAGVILAVLPLFIESIPAYRAGSQTLRFMFPSSKSKARLALKIDKLVLQLRIQKIHLESNLITLFKRSDPAGEFHDSSGPLPCNRNHALWQPESGMKEKVREYLCKYHEDAFDVFLTTLETYQTHLGRIGDHLLNVTGFKEEGADRMDLKALADWYHHFNTSDGGPIGLGAQWKFVMKHSDIKSLISELDETKLSIKRFIEARSIDQTH